MADQRKFLQTQVFRLQSSISTTDTTIVLQSFKLPDGSTTITTTDIGAKAYATIEPGTSREEQISFTGITQNGDGTADLTGVTRGLAFDAPYTETSALKQQHGANATLVLTNTAGFYNDFANKNNDETITQTYTFEKFPVKSGSLTPTSTDEFATKDYVDGAAGNPTNYDQNIVAGNAGETVAAGEVLYLKEADGEWYKADASASATSENLPLGIAQGAGTDGNAISGGVLIGGIDKNATYTAGSKYYVSDTAGALATSAGTVEVYVGHGDANNNLVWQHNVTLETITAAEKDALAGTSGTPSASNKYVTADDVSAAAGADKIVRATGTALPALDGSNLTNIGEAVTVTAGENISAGNYVALAVGQGDLQTDIGTNSTFTDLSTIDTQLISQSFTTSADTEYLIAWEADGGTWVGVNNDGALTVRIHEDNGGEPGSVLYSYETSVNAAEGVKDYFPEPVTVTESTQYHISLAKAVGADDYRVYRGNTAGQGTYTSANTGSTWSAENGAVDLKIYDFNDPTVYRAYKADANGGASVTDATDLYNRVIGVATGAITSGNTGTVKVTGVYTTSGLTPGATYYLSDTAGAVSTTAGSNSRRVGIAISDTELLISILDNE